ncbi:hypothetical protein QBC41DRAFT_62345 [Cercophora samala]|uniref:Uncharacterized protein n=1 Tax=Cercophora samala TaxID=330535 RepID=A0AA40DED8_9PEZI|nr:hypothetical protein QBC41DRAFT_62345 [Cercophora samala]
MGWRPEIGRPWCSLFRLFRLLLLLLAAGPIHASCSPSYHPPVRFANPALACRSCVHIISLDLSPTAPRAKRTLFLPSLLFQSPPLSLKLQQQQQQLHYYLLHTPSPVDGTWWPSLTFYRQYGGNIVSFTSTTATISIPPRSTCPYATTDASSITTALCMHQPERPCYCRQPSTLPPRTRRHSSSDSTRKNWTRISSGVDDTIIRRLHSKQFGTHRTSTEAIEYSNHLRD